MWVSISLVSIFYNKNIQKVGENEPEKTKCRAKKKMQFVVQRHEVKNEYNSPQLPLSNSHQNFATIGFLRVFLHANCIELK